MENKTVNAAIPPATDPPKSLRLRVEARVQDIRKLLAAEGGANSTSKRGRSLIQLLNSAQSAISHGWERVGATETAQLTTWLANTEDLKAVG